MDDIGDAEWVMDYFYSEGWGGGDGEDIESQWYSHITVPECLGKNALLAHLKEVQSNYFYMASVLAAALAWVAAVNWITPGYYTSPVIAFMIIGEGVATLGYAFMQYQIDEVQGSPCKAYHPY